MISDFDWKRERKNIRTLQIYYLIVTFIYLYFYASHMTSKILEKLNLEKFSIMDAFEIVDFMKASNCENKTIWDYITTKEATA